MTLRLPSSMRDEMIAQAVEELPNECCGIILGKDGAAVELRRMRNAEASPFRYVIDPDDLFKAERDCTKNDWDIHVIYHSHVASDAYPSPTDVRLAQWPGDPPSDLYPDAYYVLVSLKDRDNPSVRAYRINGGVVTEEPVETF